MHIAATRIDEQGNIRFRISMVFIIVLLLFSIIIARLFQKQIIQYDHYTKMAFNQRYREEKIASPRGEIYVTDIYSDKKYPLVTNKTLWAVMVIPNQVTDAQGLANSLGPIIDMPAGEIIKLLEENKVYIPPLKHKLSDDQRKAIEGLKLNGVMMIPEPYRDYPEGNMGAKFLGFVDANGDGKYGIEGYLDDVLKGKYGKLIAERDILGRQITAAGNKIIPPKEGKDVVLTIDRVIQFLAENAIKEAIEKHSADSGSVVIMEPKSGGILALAEYPTYNPAEYAEIKQEDYEIFQSRVASNAYEPGSVFKPLAMASGLDTGEVTPDTGDYFEANIQFEDFTVWNSERKARGYETMTQVLENSDNIGMAWMVEKVGKDRLFDYVDRFGFGNITDVEIEGEAPGMVQDKKYIPRVGVATMSFGQGISVTQMQLVQAIGSIANNGLLIKPHIVKEYIDKNGNREEVKPEIIGRILSEETANDLSNMLVSVVERGHGKQAAVKGYRIAGKTGTAQIPNTEKGGYYEDRFTGSFLGFGPTDNPMFVMVVRIDFPKDVIWAESTAAPVFGKLAKQILDYYQIPPDEDWVREQDRIKEEFKKEMLKRLQAD